MYIPENQLSNDKKLMPSAEVFVNFCDISQKFVEYR